MQWAEDAEAFGADPRGDLQRQRCQHACSGPEGEKSSEQILGGNCRKRSNGTTQTTCARKEAHKRISGRNYLKKLSAQMSKNNPISQLRSRWARVQIFNMSEKIHGFAFGSDQKQLHKTCSRCLIIPIFPIKRAHQEYRRRQNTRGDDFVNKQVG